MKIGREQVPSFMTLNYSFAGAKMFGQFLQPAMWDLEIEMVVLVNDKDPEQDTDEFGDVVFNKLLFWLETTMPNIIVSDINNQEGISIITAIDNSMMYTPGEPSDALIVRLLHSKISAILSSHLALGRIKLKSTDQMVSYVFELDSTNGYSLPSLPDYCPADVTHDIPWWARPDGFCFEFILPEDEDERKEAIAVYEKIEDPLAQFDEYHANLDEEMQGGNKPAEIIEVPWNPKKI